MDQYIQSDQFDISYYKATHDTKKRLKKSLVQSKINFEKTIQKYYDMLLDPDIKEIQKPAINRLIEETTAKTNELQEKIKIADESMSMYQAIVKKKNIKTLNHDTIIEDEVLIKQIIRVMINKVVVGTQDIKIHLLEN